jgi:CHASE2 domain-containing sensor protein
MHINSTGDERAKLAAANAVAAMNGRMRNKLDALDQERLAEAIVRSNAQDDLLFRNNPVRHTPPRWTLGGVLTRAVLLWRRWREGGMEDERAALSETHYKVRQSGAIGLVIAFMVSLVCGLIEFGLPAELALQMARDKVRPIAASGDIVVIAQDDKSAETFGRWPWARRYDAALVDKLREMDAKTIVFDAVYENRTDLRNDNAFAAALDRANGKVWLGVQFDENRMNGLYTSVLPMNSFITKSRQAHSNIWHDAFGYTKNVPFYNEISGRRYISSASVLANASMRSDDLRPDTAVRFKSIPTFSMIDVLQGRIERSALAGKSVIIGNTVGANGNVRPILGQGVAPSVYTRVIAAETIKNGVARELGWLPPLLAAMMIGLVCVVQGARQRRAWTLAAGALGLLAMMLIGDRTGLHFEMVPALLLLSIFAVREYAKRKVMIAQTTHPISGLPDLTELHYIKGRENCTILALKVEQYPAVVGKLPPQRQRDMIYAVAARIAIVSPDSVVHQGDDGLFVWLIPHGSERDFDTLPGQLIALFMVDVCDSYDTRMIGVSTGRCADLNLSFGERLAVASDRARVSAYITLREVL